MKKLIIAAGTGFLGQVLVNHFQNKLEEIVILTRGKSQIINGTKYVNWNARTFSGWENELENATVLINLAGKSVDCRYTKENKKEMETLMCLFGEQYIKERPTFHNVISWY